MFENILVPLDGSEHSKNALKVAAELAKKFCGKLTLIHVYSSTPPAYDVGFYPASAAEEYARGALESAKKIISEGKSNVTSFGVEVDLVLKEGHPVEEILCASRELKSDLIVMGSRGVGQMTALLLGSVSRSVSEHAKCPVLLVK